VSEHPSPERLRRWLDGRLGEAESRRIEAHLRACPQVCPAVLEAVPTAAAGCPPGGPPEGPSACPSLPGYEVLEELGRGGMSVVYLARPTWLDRLVAVKVMRAAGRAGVQEHARFLREARAMARLRHPHIVQLHQVCEHEGLPYMALELCAGGSLDRRLDGTPLPPGQAAGLTETMARAVDHAHGRGVIHRDLKPANILLRRKPSAEIRNPKQARSDFAFRISDFVPKVTDFGQATTGGGDGGPGPGGQLVGTPGYMAPEQAAGSPREVGAAADIYALGAILYELLTGRPPFIAATPLETVLRVIADDPVPPTRLQPGTPRDLEAVCLTCLHKEPNRRYASALALAEDLARFRAGQPVRARA
jgi:serine/threonine protein kinase